MIRKQEIISFATHCTAFLASIAGIIILWIASGSSPLLKGVSLVYGASVSFLFLASTMYHARKRTEDDNSIWRKIDHFAIFVMIAGTYTPISFVYLDGPMLYVVLSIQWGLVLAGGIFKFLYLSAPRILSTLVYVAMGWMAVFVIKYFRDTMPLSQMVLVLAGGLSYTAGAVFYALKKPVIVRDLLGFHEIFHVFIIAGAAFHYAAVFRAVAGV
jgi:hemolysin III